MGRLALCWWGWVIAGVSIASCGGQSSSAVAAPSDDGGVATLDATSELAISPRKEAASDAPSDAIDEDALGRACQSDADCGGLHCIQSTDDLGIRGAGGPANGYCSVDCTAQTKAIGSTDVCGPLSAFCLHFGAPGTISPSWCMRICALGPLPKCQGRSDVACAIVGPRPLCMPVCASDADCDGRRCNVGTGFCDNEPFVSDPLYTTCAAGAANTGCPGVCAAAYQPPAGQTGRGLCTRNCVVGSPDACGMMARGIDQPPNLPPVSTGRVGTCIGDDRGGPGDIGLCYQLCDTVADCRDKDPGTVCDPFLKAVLGHGVCLPPDMPVADAGRPIVVDAAPAVDAASVVDATSAEAASVVDASSEPD